MSGHDKFCAKIGVVAIGRNEGERLNTCLESVVGIARRIVYVDSGSTDDSVEMALAFGVEVVRLDLRTPFTAARARNEGFKRLCEIGPNLIYVQFVDGDCEIVAGWLEKAVTFLEVHSDVAVVCGRLRERHPERSIYNMLCDIEWDAPLGEIRASGGNAMVRAGAFEKVDGYRADIIAGEESELCIRLRAAGWQIWRLDAEMAIHDAAMMRFRQWWKRSQRTGYAFAEGASIHGVPPERHWVRESRSAWLWGFVIPVVTVGASLWIGPWAAALLLVYPLQVLRLFLRGTRSPRENFWRATFLVLGKFPELLGQAKFLLDRALGSRSRLTEQE